MTQKIKQLNTVFINSIFIYNSNKTKAVKIGTNISNQIILLPYKLNSELFIKLEPIEFFSYDEANKFSNIFLNKD